jgi:hypothetical protein
MTFSSQGTWLKASTWKIERAAVNWLGVRRRGNRTMGLACKGRSSCAMIVRRNRPGVLRFRGGRWRVCRRSPVEWEGKARGYRNMAGRSSLARENESRGGVVACDQRCLDAVLALHRNWAACILSNSTQPSR